MPRAPSATILAHLRRRIARGELSPGELVPSTRAIMRRWGVAMATATKVLGTLRDEGLVASVPGVGMVVQRRRARAPRPAPTRRVARDDGLTRERIVATALRIADAEGLDGISMRRVATELGAAPMSLYRHVTDKDDLLVLTMDAALGELTLTTTERGWRVRLELVARSLWRLFRRHPWLALGLSLTRPQLIPRGLAATEFVLATLQEVGLDEAESMSVHLALMSYLRGTAASFELEAQAEAETGQSSEAFLHQQEPQLRALLARGDHPTFERINAARHALDLDAIFEVGLRLFLDGLDRRLG